MYSHVFFRQILIPTISGVPKNSLLHLFLSRNLKFDKQNYIKVVHDVLIFGLCLSPEKPNIYIYILDFFFICFKLPSKLAMIKGINLSKNQT